MRRVIASDDVARLLRSAKRLAHIAQTIGERAQASQDVLMPDVLSVGLPLDPLPAGQLVQMARDTIGAYRRQPDFGAPALFRNSAWVLMLELFIAKRCALAVPVKVACSMLGGAPTTALRTILELEQLELIASTSDSTDARRRLLCLTTYADNILHAYLAEKMESRTVPLRLSLKLSRQDDGDDNDRSNGDIEPSVGRSDSEPDTVLQ